MQGFQLLKNSKPYGSVIPSDVRGVPVKGLKLGDRVELQLITLTNRAPAGSQSHKSNWSYIRLFTNTLIFTDAALIAVRTDGARQSKRRPAHQCRVLPPGEFNGMIFLTYHYRSVLTIYITINLTVVMLQVTNVVAKMVAKLQDQPTRCHLWTPVFVMLQPDTRTKSNTLLTVAGMRYLFVRTVSRDYSLPSWLSGENHCAVVCTACVAVRSRRSRVQIQARWLVSACRSTKCIFRE